MTHRHSSARWLRTRAPWAWARSPQPPYDGVACIIPSCRPTPEPLGSGVRGAGVNGCYQSLLLPCFSTASRRLAVIVPSRRRQPPPDPPWSSCARVDCPVTHHGQLKPPGHSLHPHMATTAAPSVTLSVHSHCTSCSSSRQWLTVILLVTALWRNQAVCTGLHTCVREWGLEPTHGRGAAKRSSSAPQQYQPSSSC